MSNKVKFCNLLVFPLVLALLFLSGKSYAKEFSETSFLIAKIQPSNFNNQRLLDFLESNNNSGMQFSLTEENGEISLAGSQYSFTSILEKINQFITADSAKVIPVFIHFEGEMRVLDSIISHSEIASQIFYLPRGEAWPTMDYLIQANRRVLFFVSGNVENPGRTIHFTDDYIFQISAEMAKTGKNNKTNLELFLIQDFENLPVNSIPGSNIQNLVPDYINFLLESWTRYGKKPNFIFVGEEILNFNFIISQLNSFTWITGTIRGAGKTFEKVYWKNPEVSVTGGRFSFPYRGGDELTLTPFVPGYRMTPEQIIVTGEMEVPESYQIMANPLSLSQGLTGNFHFDEEIQNVLFPEKTYSGENYSFSQDIERGTVLRLPENSNVNLGSPEVFGLRNSSFTVSCFVKFSEILEFGDNAVLGNYESEYRRGLHLILRSGHPYFGLWANDYISEEKLEPNIWYHIVWRYILETGEQAIFLNGRNIGSSEGHPPFSGTADIHLGSALSQGASLRGYIDDLHFWNRPLGSEEITRLALNEEVKTVEESKSTQRLTEGKALITSLVLIAIFIVAVILYFIFRKKKTVMKGNSVWVPEKNAANQVRLFGGFKAIDRDGNDISALFTPKVKELFLFILIATLKNQNGASVSEIDEQLWSGLPAKKVSNNRAVTLNKLRKILQKFDGVEIVTQNGHLLAKTEKSFFCDYAEAYKLCQISGGMDKTQLEAFFHLVKNGRFLKGLNWDWLDEIRGYTGNQVIDNLLKLAVYYNNTNELPKMDALAKRILEYDDLSDEATWLQVWVLRQMNNIHQAKFHFESFCSKYQNTMGETYPMNFEQFNTHFSDLLKINGLK
ncbi:LamG-like jellyroll fold domain-containing protein [Mariniphaga sp.]|uniref:LamG-like jellyroll fold domain-containing protein n=1 Tax=Mariniphaga sp. TaxID=1954475 RepID=UPI003563A034